ncbi:MAG TPA: hypothetical protein VM049_01280 [Gaiellaceae bacterium]|nr:hypothetical protein [Gaiellaceae bacterium]
MFRTILAAALVASVLATAHHERVLDRSGLLGSCSAVATATEDGGEWLACKPGDLTGYPDLSNDSCTRGGMRGEVRFWHCPTALVASDTTDETATR